MHTPHMVIDPFAVRECLQAHPTDMRLALCARHVVAPLYPFDRDSTTWAVLDIVVLHPFLEQAVPTLGTCKAIVCFYMAVRADAGET